MTDELSDTTGRGSGFGSGTSGKGRRPLEGPTCQSCGRGLRRPDLFGSEKSGAMSTTYCKHCYWKGEFTEPEITLEQMIGKVADMLVRSRKLTPAVAQDRARALVPKLKRWKEG